MAFEVVQEEEKIWRETKSVVVFKKLNIYFYFVLKMENLLLSLRLERRISF